MEVLHGEIPACCICRAFVFSTYAGFLPISNIHQPTCCFGYSSMLEMYSSTSSAPAAKLPARVLKILGFLLLMKQHLVYDPIKSLSFRANWIISNDFHGQNEQNQQKNSRQLCVFLPESRWVVYMSDSTKKQKNIHHPELRRAGRSRSDRHRKQRPLCTFHRLLIGDCEGGGRLCRGALVPLRLEHHGRREGGADRPTNDQRVGLCCAFLCCAASERRSKVWRWKMSQMMLVMVKGRLFSGHSQNAVKDDLCEWNLGLFNSGEF